ncbi:MAG: DUF3566 domain-containing protein [Pseudoclavibacter sp.]|jgi:hypothetical protein
MSSTTASKLASKTASTKSKRRTVDLQVSHIGLWSATKISFLVALGLSLASIVLAFVLWLLASQLGMFNALNDLLSTMGTGGTASSGGVDIGKVFNLGLIMSFAMMGGLVNLVFGTLIGTVAAWLYNVCVMLVGGIEVHFTNLR